MEGSVSVLSVAILAQHLSNSVATMSLEATQEVSENWLLLGWLPMMPLSSSGKMFRKIIFKAGERVRAFYSHSGCVSWWDATVMWHNWGEQTVGLQFSNWIDSLPEWRVSHLIDSSTSCHNDGCDHQRCVPNAEDSLNEIVYTLHKQTGQFAEGLVVGYDCARKSVKLRWTLWPEEEVEVDEEKIYWDLPTWSLRGPTVENVENFSVNIGDHN